MMNKDIIYGTPKEIIVSEDSPNKEKILSTDQENTIYHVINDNKNVFQNIEGYVERCRKLGSLKEVIAKIPLNLLPDDDKECKKVVEKIVELYFK